MQNSLVPLPARPLTKELHGPGHGVANVLPLLPLLTLFVDHPVRVIELAVSGVVLWVDNVSRYLDPVAPPQRIEVLSGESGGVRRSSIVLEHDARKE